MFTNAIFKYFPYGEKWNQFFWWYFYLFNYLYTHLFICLLIIHTFTHSSRLKSIWNILLHAAEYHAYLIIYSNFSCYLCILIILLILLSSAMNLQSVTHRIEEKKQRKQNRLKLKDLELQRKFWLRSVFIVKNHLEILSKLPKQINKWVYE